MKAGRRPAQSSLDEAQLKLPAEPAQGFQAMRDQDSLQSEDVKARVPDG